MTRQRTISLAEDRRARVPFAVIAALLLLSSGTLIFLLEKREEPQKTRDPAESATETRSAVKSAMKEAAEESLEKAGEKPVTKPADTPAGRALSESSTFEDYVKLRYYLNLQRRLDRIERQQSRIRDANVSIEVKLPRARYEEESIENAIDRIEINRTDKQNPPGSPTSGTAVEYVELDAGTVPIVIYEDGEEVYNDSIAMSTTSQSAVFDLHEKTEDFQASFNEEIYGGMYPVLTAMIYGTATLERFLGEPTSAFAFDKQITSLEIREVLNGMAYASMRSTFETTPKGNNAQAVAGGCLGVYYASRLGTPVGADVAPPDVICTALHDRFLKDQRFPEGESFASNIRELGKERADNPNGGQTPAFDDGTYDSETQQHRNELASLSSSTIESRLEGEQNFTIYRDAVTRVALQNVTGRTFTADRGDADEIAEVQNRTPVKESMLDGHDLDRPTDQPWMGGSFSDEVRDVINDTYTVGSTVKDARLVEGSLNNSSSRRFVASGDFTADIVTNGTNGGTREVVVSLPVRIEEDGSWTKQVVFNTTVSTADDRSVNTTVEEKGIRYPNWPPAGVETSHLPTFRDGYWGQFQTQNGDVNLTGDESADEDEIESYLDDTVDTNVTAVSEFQAAVDSGLNTNGTRLAHEPVTAGRSPFQNWLITELEQTVEDVDNKTVETNITSYLDENGTSFTELKINQSEKDTIVFDDTLSNGQYVTPAERALAELRKRWVETANWYLEKAEERKQNRVSMLESKLEDRPGPNTLSESYKQGMENATKSWGVFRDGDGNSETVVDYNVDEDQGSASPYQLNVDPEWLGYFPKTASDLQTSNPRDEIRGDSERIRHTSMAQRRVFMLPSPGLPIVPAPFLWFVSANNYYANVKGEYARFQVKPRAPENHVANTSYVKQPGPVSLEFNGLRRPVGEVTPIDYNIHYEMPVLMVGKTPVQNGNWGIGDYLFANVNPFVECSPTFPRTGPGSQAEDRDNSKCGTLGPIGEAISGVLSIAGGGFGIGGLKKKFMKKKKMRRDFEEERANRLNEEINELKDYGSPSDLGPGPRPGTAEYRARQNARQAEIRTEVNNRLGRLTEDIREQRRTREYKSEFRQWRRGLSKEQKKYYDELSDLEVNKPRFYSVEKVFPNQRTRIRQMRRGWDGVDTDNWPTQSKGYKRWRTEANSGIVQGTESTASIAGAMAMRDGSYDAVECPKREYKPRDEYTKGCDDNQLEVEVYPDDDGTVVSIESQIESELGDRTLHFQTRPNVAGPSDQRLLLSDGDDVVYDNIDHSAKDGVISIPEEQPDGSTTDVDVETNHSTYLNQTADGDYAFQNKTGVVKPASGAEDAILADTNITVLEPQTDGNAPMLQIVYDGYAFLIALMEGNDVDWDHYRDALSGDRFDADGVNVFIGSTEAQKELSSELSPRSSVVVDEGGVSPDHECTDDPMSVYYGDQTGERIEFRVDEADRLFGPEDEPNEFC